MSFSRRRFFSENLGEQKDPRRYISIYISGLMGRLEVAGNGIRQRPAGSLVTASGGAGVATMNIDQLFSRAYVSVSTFFRAVPLSIPTTR